MTIVRQARSVSGNSTWECQCDCGSPIKTVWAQDLRAGKVVSCGCHKAEMASARGTHHMSKHPSYASWKNMRARCENPNAEGYEQYGGRGITFCERWRDFDNFWIDMGKTWRPRLSLDRIDVNGNYEPGNVRWATSKTQARNRRNNHIIDTPDGPMNIAEAAEKYGVKFHTIVARLRYGWTDPHDLVKPAMDKTAYLRQYRK
jgi:hypothetical protein